MCQLYVGAEPELWESQTRSFRIEGMVTSVRLENLFWRTLEEIAGRDQSPLSKLITELYNESLDEGHDLGNFTSFLRVCCLRFINLQHQGLLPSDTSAPELSTEEILRREKALRDGAQDQANQKIA